MNLIFSYTHKIYLSSVFFSGLQTLSRDSGQYLSRIILQSCTRLDSEANATAGNIEFHFAFSHNGIVVGFIGRIYLFIYLFIYSEFCFIALGYCKVIPYSMKGLMKDETNQTLFKSKINFNFEDINVTCTESTRRISFLWISAIVSYQYLL